MKSFVLASFVLISLFGQTQVVSTSFLIVNSTKKYSFALKSAQAAANKLGIPMNLRNCFKDKENGLSSSEVCGCGEAHGYIPRGRYDAGEYISIEYSFAFDSFSPGYYIVVVASGELDKVNELLPKAREYAKSAYVKKSNVYIGCMH